MTTPDWLLLVWTAMLQAWPDSQIFCCCVLLRRYTRYGFMASQLLLLRDACCGCVGACTG